MSERSYHGATSHSENNNNEDNNDDDDDDDDDDDVDDDDFSQYLQSHEFSINDRSEL